MNSAPGRILLGAKAPENLYIVYQSRIISDIAIFVLKTDLQHELTNYADQEIAKHRAVRLTSTDQRQCSNEAKM